MKSSISNLSGYEKEYILNVPYGRDSIPITNRLKESFEFARRVFFPRWDKNREWGIKRVWHLPADGKCDRVSKNILLKGLSPEEDELFCILTLLLHKGMVESAAYHHKKAVSTPLIILFKGHYLGDPVDYVDLTACLYGQGFDESKRRI